MMVLSKAHLAASCEVAGLLRHSPADLLRGLLVNRRLLNGLEFFFTELLRCKYDQWAGEAIDSLYPVVCQPDGSAGLHIRGAACLLSDQWNTPFSVRLRSGVPDTGFEDVRLLLGTPGGGPLGISVAPYGSPGVDDLSRRIADNLDVIPWVFEVDFSRAM